MGPNHVQSGHIVFNGVILDIMIKFSHDVGIDIYYYNLGVFAYQTFTNGCPHFFDNYAISHNKPARYITRSTSNTVFDFTTDPIFYNQPHLQKTLQSINFAAAALWNKLPITLKQLNNVATFKYQLKAWLTKDYISSRETIKTDIPDVP